METFKHKEEHANKPAPKSARRRRALEFAGGVAAFVVIVVLVPTSIAIGYDQYFAGKIFPSVRTNAGSLSGLTQTQAKSLIEKRINEMLDGGITFSLNGTRFSITHTNIDAKQLIKFDVDAAVEQAFTLGREGDAITQTAERYRLILGGQSVAIPFDMDVQAITELVSKQFAAQVQPAVDAAPLVKLDGNGDIVSVGVLPASSGATPRFLDAVNALRDRIADFQNPTMAIPVDAIEPTIRVADAEPHLAEVSTLLVPRQLMIIHDTSSWTLSRRDIAGALAFIKTPDGLQTGIDLAKLKTFLKPIRKAVEVPAVNAIFTMKEEKVVEFQPDKQGLGIDEDALTSALRDALYQKRAGIELPLKATDPEITTEKSNSLGINEALGSGTSSFKGSPVNRIKNIKNGASRLNLALVAPDEEFSLVTVLKPFDEDHGYSPELVIKGKTIVPEVGGGLCQIGTTTFRSVMNSGLPITMRQNHSLVVSYYNDPSNGLPGSDATIYDPSPDFKFVNDTGHYLLFTTEVVGKTGLKFTVWGTPDGRKGFYDPPTVSKWTPVPKDAATLYLESDTVLPGKQSCEHGFPGAIASMDYTIQHPDGTKTVRTFTSVYHMLEPVCLVAKGELPVPDPALAAAPSPTSDVPISTTDTAAAQ